MFCGLMNAFAKGLFVACLYGSMLHTAAIDQVSEMEGGVEKKHHGLMRKETEVVVQVQGPMAGAAKDTMVGSKHDGRQRHDGRSRQDTMGTEAVQDTMAGKEALKEQGRHDLEEPKVESQVQFSVLTHHEDAHSSAAYVQIESTSEVKGKSGGVMTWQNMLWVLLGISFVVLFANFAIAMRANGVNLRRRSFERAAADSRTAADPLNKKKSSRKAGEKPDGEKKAGEAESESDSDSDTDEAEVMEF
jgi:hypothetical protein